MTYIRNNRTIVFIIAVLLLSNFALLYILFGRDNSKPKQPAQPEFKSFRDYMSATLKNEVGFSDDQVKQYQDLSQKHKEGMKVLFDDIKNTKDTLYKFVFVDNVPDSVTDSYLNKIGDKQKNIDQRISNHFRTLRGLCTADQRPKFDSITQRIIYKIIGLDKKLKENTNEKKQ